MHHEPVFGRFSAAAALREVWSRLIGARRTYLYMAVTAGIVGWLIGNLLLGWVLPAAEPTMVTLPDGQVAPLSPGSGPAIDLPGGGSWSLFPAATAYPWVQRTVSAAISALFAGAFAAYALRRAVGLPVRYGMLLDFVRFFPKFLVLGLLAFGAALVLAKFWPMVALLGTAVGAVAFAFADLYVVDRDAGVIEALQGSLNIVRNNPVQTALILLTAALLGALVSVPLLIASTFLPSALAVVVGLATMLASALVSAFVSVALACAFRDAVGIHTAGEGTPLKIDAGGAARRCNCLTSRGLRSVRTERHLEPLVRVVELDLRRGEPLRIERHAARQLPTKPCRVLFVLLVVRVTQNL